MTAQLVDLVEAYDVSGLVGEQLYPDVAYALGPSFAQVSALPERAGTVVGHDVRPSSPPLPRSLAHGVAAHGLDVDRVGSRALGLIRLGTTRTREPGHNRGATPTSTARVHRRIS